jgi:hypothetical protein
MKVIGNYLFQLFQLIMFGLVYLPWELDTFREAIFESKGPK